jgi:hypothetical protein
MAANLCERRAAVQITGGRPIPRFHRPGAQYGRYVAQGRGLGISRSGGSKTQTFDGSTLNVDSSRGRIEDDVQEFLRHERLDADEPRHLPSTASVTTPHPTVERSSVWNNRRPWRRGTSLPITHGAQPHRLRSHRPRSSMSGTVAHSVLTAAFAASSPGRGSISSCNCPGQPGL